MVIENIPSLGIALGIMESMISKSLIESVEERCRDGKFRNEFVMFKFLVKMKHESSHKSLETKLRRKSSKDFFCTDTLARNMAHVAIAAALAASASRNLEEEEDDDDEEEDEEEEEEEDEKEKVKMEDPKVITRMDISDDNDDGITKAQRESIDRLLLQTSKSVPTYSSKPSSITLSFNPFRSRDVSNILRRKLKQYIGDLQKLQKQTINEYVSSIFLFCILNLTYALTNTTDTMLRFRVVWRYKRNGRNNSRNFVSGPESHTFQFSNLVQNFEWKNLESKEIQYELR